MKHRNHIVLHKTAILKSFIVAFIFIIIAPAIGSTELDLFADLEAPTAPAQGTALPASQPTPTTLDLTPNASSGDLTFDTLDTPAAGPVAPTARAGAEEELSIPIYLPVIGTVNLIPFSEKDPKSGKDVSGMKVYVPAKGKKLVSGPLTIDEGELRLINDLPSYQARATLFGSSATLSIKKAVKATKTTTEQEAFPATPAKMKAPSFSRIVFGIKFDTVPTIELIPGQKAKLADTSVLCLLI